MRQRARTEARYDTSQLTDKNRGSSVNRDYLAHCFRWGWVGRNFVESRKTRVLDAGCGRDCPLAKVMCFNVSVVPKLYFGVDMQEVDRAPGAAWVETLGGFDFATRWPELRDAALDDGGLFDLVVSFEVVEHMAKEDGLRYLAGLRGMCADDGRVLLSTPVFNGRAAAAHLHEWEVAELKEALEGVGLEVVDRFGTFASYPQVKKVAPPELLAVLERAREFYSDNVLACFLAPLYPDHSRNNAWVCKPKR